MTRQKLFQQALREEGPAQALTGLKSWGYSLFHPQPAPCLRCGDSRLVGHALFPVACPDCTSLR